MNPETLLDDPKRLRDHDPGNMLGLVESFPAQFLTRPSESDRASLDGLPPAAHLWVAAMGGSAFAGDVLAAGLFAAGVSTAVVRGYRLPAAARPGDWLLAISYSGNTEEALSAFAEAGNRGLTQLAISSGGKVEAAAREARAPFLKLPPGLPPRAAAGYAYAAAFEVGLKLVGDRAAGHPLAEPARLAEHLTRAAAAWAPVVPQGKNRAKEIAVALHGRLPVVYSGVGPPEAAALRWRTQINENAKNLCHTAAVPELDHNEVVGWSGPDGWGEKTCVVFLHEGDEDPGTDRRLLATRDWLDRRGIPTLAVRAEGDTPLERLWWLCHLGDYVSVYLAGLRGVDPTPVTAIDELKRKLAEDNR